MEDRIQLYMSNFPDITREKAIKMITSFDNAIKERILFCKKLSLKSKKSKRK